MEEKVFGTHLVAHVRDIFDLSEKRPYLSSVFEFASSDVSIVNQAIMEPEVRRLVNEYTRNDKGEYDLTRHDVEFAEYIHSKGVRYYSPLYSPPFVGPLSYYYYFYGLFW